MPTEAEEFDTVVVAIRCAPTTAEEVTKIIRNAAQVMLDRGGLEFLLPKDRDVFDRPDGAALEWSRRPVAFTGAGPEDDLILENFWRAESPYHYFVLSPHAYIRRDAFQREWKSLIDH